MAIKGYSSSDKIAGQTSSLDRFNSGGGPDPLSQAVFISWRLTEVRFFRGGQRRARKKGGTSKADVSLYLSGGVNKGKESRHHDHRF